MKGLFAIMALSALMPFDPGPTARTPYPWELHPDAHLPRRRRKGNEDHKPSHHKDLNKPQRKVYAKVLADTGDRDVAYAEAKKV